MGKEYTRSRGVTSGAGSFRNVLVNEGFEEDNYIMKSGTVGYEIERKIDKSATKGVALWMKTKTSGAAAGNSVGVSIPISIVEASTITMYARFLTTAWDTVRSIEFTIKVSGYNIIHEFGLRIKPAADEIEYRDSGGTWTVISGETCLLSENVWTVVRLKVSVEKQEYIEAYIGEQKLGVGGIKYKGGINEEERSAEYKVELVTNENSPKEVYIDSVMAIKDE
jgi:hypothetical protein